MAIFPFASPFPLLNGFFVDPQIESTLFSGVLKALSVFVPRAPMVRGVRHPCAVLPGKLNCCFVLLERYTPSSATCARSLGRTSRCALAKTGVEPRLLFSTGASSNADGFFQCQVPVRRRGQQEIHGNGADVSPAAPKRTSAGRALRGKR